MEEKYVNESLSISPESNDVHLTSVCIKGERGPFIPITHALIYISNIYVYVCMYIFEIYMYDIYVDTHPAGGRTVVQNM